MSSNVTAIHESLKSTLQTLFPAKTLIPNPFSLEDNNQNFIRDGFGLRYGPATVSEFDLGIHIQGYTRTFEVMLTTAVYRTDIDASVYEQAQLGLIENQNTIVNTFEGVRDIDENVVAIEFVSDGGIEFVFADKNNYLALTTSFAVSYRENKTYN